MDLFQLPQDVFGEILPLLSLQERFSSFALVSRASLALAYSCPLPYFPLGQIPIFTSKFGELSIGILDEIEKGTHLGEWMARRFSSFLSSLPFLSTLPLKTVRETDAASFSQNILELNCLLKLFPSLERFDCSISLVCDDKEGKMFDLVPHLPGFEAGKGFNVLSVVPSLNTLTLSLEDVISEVPLNFRSITDLGLTSLGIEMMEESETKISQALTSATELTRLYSEVPITTVFDIPNLEEVNLVLKGPNCSPFIENLSGSKLRELTLAFRVGALTFPQLSQFTMLNWLMIKNGHARGLDYTIGEKIHLPSLKLLTIVEYQQPLTLIRFRDLGGLESLTAIGYNYPIPSAFTGRVGMLSGLTHVYIEGDFDMKSMAAAVGRLACLTALELAYGEVNEVPQAEGVPAILLAVRQPNELRLLNLNRLGINAKTVETIAKQFPHLEKLFLGLLFCEAIDDVWFAPLLNNLHHLSSLSLERGYFHNWNLEKPPGSVSLETIHRFCETVPDLTSLRLSGVTENVWEKRLGDLFPRLEHVNLTNIGSLLQINAWTVDEYTEYFLPEDSC